MKDKPNRYIMINTLFKLFKSMMDSNHWTIFECHLTNAVTAHKVFYANVVIVSKGPQSIWKLTQCKILNNYSISAPALDRRRPISHSLSANRIYTAISKNVVGENDECQLSNGGCTTEKKCGYLILIRNNLPWWRLHTYDRNFAYQIWKPQFLSVMQSPFDNRHSPFSPTTFFDIGVYRISMFVFAHKQRYLN